MMNAFSSFILEYIFLPTAMLAYVVLTAMLMHSTVSDWLKERAEKKSKKGQPEGSEK